MEIKKLVKGVCLKWGIAFSLFSFAYFLLPFAIFVLPFALCFFSFSFSYSQNVDSIQIITKTTNEDNEKIILLTDFSERKNLGDELKLAKQAAEKAFSIAKKAEFNFGKATALTRIGEIEAKQNNFDAAYNHFQEAEQIFLKDGDKTDCAQLYFSWAKSALLYKKPDDAIRFASSALNFYVFDSQIPYFESDLHKTLGESWLQKNQQGRALGEFDESLKLLNENYTPEPIKSKLTFNIAELFFGTENYDDALTFFNAALSSDLKVSDSFRIASDRYNLAKCHLKLKETKTAMPYVTQSLAYFENHTDTLNAASNHLLLAEIYLKEGLKAKSNNELNKAANLITLLPLGNSNLIAINELSRLYGKIGDRQKEKLYLLKYTSYKKNSQPKNGDIFTTNSEETSVAEKQNFIQNLKYNIDAKFFIILFGVASILATVFLFPKSKKKLAVSDEQIILENETLELKKEPITLFNNQSEKYFIKNAISNFLTQLSATLNKQDLLLATEMFFKEDDNFLIHPVQQKNIENLLESIFKAAKINFGEPIRSLKFSESDVEAHSFTLKTIIELPRNVEKEKVFKSTLTSNHSNVSFDGCITEFKNQIAKTNSSAIFAHLGATDYLIIFTEVFNVSE